MNIIRYLALVGADLATDACSSLSELESIAEVLVLPPDPSVNSPISTHPDTILCIFRGNIYCHETYAAHAANELAEITKVCGLKLYPCGGERSGTYPFDTAYNALCAPDCSSFIIARRSSICEPLKPFCCNTRQGYASCCALTVNGTIITADPSILKTAELAGLPSHRIQGGGIKLKGYDKGFIGGCTGVIHNSCTDTVLTVGDPDSCEAGRELAALCEKMNVPVIPLDSGPLTDVGGIKLIPIK